MISVTLHLDRWGINMTLEDTRTGQAMAFRNEARSNPMGALKMVRGSQGLQGISPNQSPQGA